MVIRWHLQLGLVVIPKSVTPERIAQNFDVFDFCLSDGEMDAIAGLDRAGAPGRTPNVRPAMSVAEAQAADYLRKRLRARRWRRPCGERRSGAFRRQRRRSGR